MPQPGPTPKRHAMKAGHNAKSEAPDRVVVHGRVSQPDPRPEWSDSTVAWYQSLAASGASAHYEPSDWQVALVTGDMMEQLIISPSASLFDSIQKSWARLGCTEDARRRMRLEIERPDSGADEEEGDLIPFPEVIGGD